jgi:hypothetical protein
MIDKINADMICGRGLFPIKIITSISSAFLIDVIFWLLKVLMEDVEY